MKVYNFSAGPAMLPEDVMKIAQAEFCNFMNSGSGLIELSHRGKQFTEVIDRAVANIRELMNISDDYSVMFIQGGASMQFAMLAMNLLGDKTADYADTGVWSNKAYKEAANLGKARIVCSSKEDKYAYIPDFAKWEATPDDAAYLHITSNNTVAGTQYRVFPKTNVPLIADMSSDIMSREVNVNDFGMIYAGAQKNLGPSGMAVVIMRNDLLERTPANLPTMLK